MKTKLAIVAFILVSSSGCMTTTNSYTRDIVYRDGSYYSPADEQYGDYYYEPEPDYSYYADDYYYGYGFNSGYYGSRDSYRCRFSYRHDRYCNTGWGGSYLNFGGLTIIFGNSNYYGYGYGYPSYGYPGHGYHHGYPYYGWHSPRPQPHNNNPIPRSKPRPNYRTPDPYFSTAPGMRVSGEPVRMQTKPALLDESPEQAVAEPQDQQNRNPYTRTRQPRPNIRPEIWRDNPRTDGSIVIRDDNGQQRRTKPALVNEQDAYVPMERPVRQNRRVQPYPMPVDSPRERQRTPVIEYSEPAPAERVQRDNRQQRPAPRIERPERVERIERVERVERIDRSGSGRAVNRESSDDGNGSN